jgi:hypothetical protein
MSNGPMGRRLGKRVAGRTRARIVDLNGCVTDVYVLDLSTSGARIETPLDASIARCFTLKIAGRETEAEIVWRRGRELGARFVVADEAAGKARPLVAPAIKKVSLDQLRGLARASRR